MEIKDRSGSELIHLDFEQARARHLLFKSRLRSILYGIEMDESPVASHHECAVGKWIYSHALESYGHINEMHELEKIHADIHTSARGLIQLYKEGKVEEARKGLTSMEKIADHLVRLLSIVELKLKENPSIELETKKYNNVLDINLKELYELQRVNFELDARIKEQSTELYKVKERFELVAKATQDAVWDWDLHTNVVWWNNGLKEMFGYKDEDILPDIESRYNGIHPEDRATVIAGINAIINSGGKNWSKNYRFRRSDGSYAFVFDRGYVLYDKDGKPYRMVGSMQDITEEKESKEALHRAQSQLESALSAGLVSTFFWDIKKDLFYADANLAQLFSVSPKEAAKGLPLRFLVEAIHPDDVSRVMELVNRAIATGQEYVADYRVRSSENDYRWVVARGKVNYNTAGEPIDFPGTLVDITDRKQVEEALAKSEEQFRNFGNNIQNLAWIANGDGWIFWYNTRWYEYTGTTYEEMQGWGWQKVHHPEHTERIVAFAKEAWKKDEPFELTFPLRRHDGVYRWFLTRVVPIKDKTGNICQWIGTNTDINDKIEIEQNLERRVLERTRALQETNQKLERSNAELEQFTYISSHDLREPLRKIHTFAHMVKDNTLEYIDEISRNYLDKIISTSTRMSNMLKDLLTYAKLQDEEAITPSNLHELITNILEDLELSISQSRASIYLTELPVIQCHQLQIKQLFYNLIGNAIKFQQPDLNPIIHISAKKISNEEIVRHGLIKDGNEYWDIIVKDNGIGFDQKYADQIFTIFQRLNGRSAYDGTGIGLAICKKVVVNHGGKIYAISSTGNGSEFHVILPQSLRYSGHDS